MDPKLTTELLLSCAHSRLTSAQAQAVRSLARVPVDWEELVSLAADHGVLPLLHVSLKTAGVPALPTDVRTWLTERFLENAQRNLLMARELGAIVALLAEHGIAAIPFKGPVLTVDAYGNLALRQFQDLDILVREPQLQRAKELLSTRGYQRPREPARPEGSHECRLQHDRLPLLVELHWRLTPRHWPFALDLEILWQRLTTIALAGREVPHLPPPENLLVLCVHGAKHQWSRLDWVCCVAELLRAHPDIDWSRVLDLARSCQSERILFLGLALARDLLGTNLPAVMAPAIDRDDTVPALVHEVRRRMFCAAPVELDTFAHAAFYFRMRERIQDKVPFFIHRVRSLLAAAEEDGKHVRLPRFCGFLSYVIVPLRLVRRYGIWRIMRHVLGR